MLRFWRHMGVVTVVVFDHHELGNLNDDGACKLFGALRVTAVKFGLELASQSTARRDAKEAPDARTALRKRWVGVVGQLGRGYRTARGAEMPGWVAVAHLPSYKVRRILHKWSVEVTRAVMPNRERALHSFFSAAGARGSAAPAPPETSAAASAKEVPTSSASAGGPAGDDAEESAQPKGVIVARRSEATATPIRARSHDTGAMPMPWGAKPKQDALRGVIRSFDLDGRCSYAATPKCHSAAWHWSRCIVVDHQGVVEQWEDTVRIPLADLIRCKRCVVGIHPACAIDYSEWPGGAGKPGGVYDKLDIHRGSLLCCNS